MTDWVFLRGLTRESAHWGGFPARFQSALSGVRVHLFDLPGNGPRHAERSPATVAALVADCRAQLRARGTPAPVNVLALSLGAMVATEWARTAPTDLGACVLVNTSLRPFSPFHHRLLPHNYPTLWRLALGRMPAEAIERAVFRITCNHADRQDSVVPHWTQARQRHPVQPGNALRQLLAAARYRGPRQRPAVPTLLLSSTNDQLVSYRCSQAIAHAWGCPLRAHPTAGHDLPQDDPAWVSEQVRDWIASLGP